MQAVLLLNENNLILLSIEVELSSDFINYSYILCFKLDSVADLFKSCRVVSNQLQGGCCVTLDHPLNLACDGNYRMM